MEELRADVAQLNRHLAFLEVRVAADGDPDLGVPLARASELATGWIEAYREVTLAQSGTCPVGLPAAFVLQFILDPLATVTATAALRTHWVLDPDPSSWSLDLDPSYLYPVAVQIRAGAARGVADDLERHEAAWAGYRETGTAIATALPSPTRMSSRQRVGMVTDMWEQALARSAGVAPGRRLSCCLMYGLPGCAPCAGCPRVV